MVALGSLFVCLSDATLITHRGPRDACDGVQLVLTALRGQLFALLSSDESIRATAFVWHGLGFYWARTCGMYTVGELSIPGPSQELQAHWHRWRTLETQKRAILGHYVLDGLISQTSGSPTSARHLISSLPTASSDAAFQATTADEWLKHMQQPLAYLPSVLFSEVYVSIFSPTYRTYPLNLSSFSIFVVIEGL
ncbi:uncharacterized protein BO97DRAFT_476638 [Aspergillus homomorphus CBS 101889]|uniref:Transcription factor domain-containing protein n=1 Tax=Aspergillus homomorphus (strain CBS 101889) TaxID=1450537 RepID=A0A395I268_ASPHC|nr:hypothetical protein BO97DRAFT_476638 [Aspergillus homomorphus CBS 101889]RAL14272.1 hypothetical protein BO97DRAFT_476638 [Aspergillus homomorphus CBS 101889]